MASETLNKILSAEAAAEKSIAEAQRQAQEIIAAANAEADEIIKRSQKEAESEIAALEGKKAAQIDLIFKENDERIREELSLIRKAAESRRAAATDAAVNIILTR